MLLFLLENAPLERWERDILEIIRDEAYYFVPQMQTKIMNEGWATYWHSQDHDPEGAASLGDHRLRRQQRGRDGGDAPGSSTRTSSASSSTATSRSAGTRASSARSGKSATTSTVRRTGTDALGLGRQKIFEVREHYNDVTFIDEFLTEDFCRENKFFSFSMNERSDTSRSSRASSAR